MAQTKTTIVDANGNVTDRVVQTEDITGANAGTASGSAFQVPKGSDFVAFINTGATNTAGAVTTDLQGSFDGTTWVDIDTSFAADCDSAVVVKAYDASASGDFPFYRVQLDSVGDDSGNTITVKITH